MLKLCVDVEVVFTARFTLEKGESFQKIGVRGSLERDISSLRALGPGGGQISRVVHVSTRAAFGVLREIRVLGGNM